VISIATRRKNPYFKFLPHQLLKMSSSIIGTTIQSKTRLVKNDLSYLEFMLNSSEKMTLNFSKK